MKGIFVNQLSAHGIPYADLIVMGKKKIETRSRNMLSACLFERVAIIRTMKGKKPIVIGYANISSVRHMMNTKAAECFAETFVPDGSKYANNRWFYWMTDAEKCKPYPLPANAVRHGRSWCEFEKEA